MLIPISLTSRHGAKNIVSKLIFQNDGFWHFRFSVKIMVFAMLFHCFLILFFTFLTFYVFRTPWHFFRVQIQRAVPAVAAALVVGVVAVPSEPPPLVATEKYSRTAPNACKTNCQSGAIIAFWLQDHSKHELDVGPSFLDRMRAVADSGIDTAASKKFLCICFSNFILV